MKINTFLVLAAMIFAMAFCGLVSCVSAATTDKDAAKEWAQANYPSCEVKFVKEMSPKLDKRANKNIVYIEVIHSVSAGGRDGWSKYGYLRYTKAVRKGKASISYAIWNPFNNSCDDIVAFVDHGKIRSDKKIIHCPDCLGLDENCVYWLQNKHRHMTDKEIQEFEWLEWHYQDKYGVWHEM